MSDEEQDKEQVQGNKASRSPGSPKSPRNGKAFGPGYIEVMVIALIVVAGALYGYDQYFAQKIMVVDLKGYVRRENAMLAAGEITKEQWQAGLDEVDKIIAIEAAKNLNRVILLKDAVLKNGEELHVHHVQ